MNKNNYHTHTTRCYHASGKDEEYVKAAIKAGIKELGFSDHIHLGIMILLLKQQCVCLKIN